MGQISTNVNKSIKDKNNTTQLALTKNRKKYSSGGRVVSTFKKVLVVDDNIINRRLLEKILQDQYTVIQANNGQEALDVLLAEEHEISVVLLDIVMPVMDGYEFLAKRQEDSKISNIPVVVTTQKEGEASEIKALKLGANDFLPKPYNGEIIKHRLANIITLRESAAFLRTIEHDELTGVYSKNFFYKKVSEVLREHPHKEYDIIVSDIVNFKLINDTYGTKIGDNLLCKMANIMSGLMSKTALCGRIGADFFAVLREHSDEYNEHIFAKADTELNSYPVEMNLTVRFGVYTLVDRKIEMGTICDRAVLAVESIKEAYGSYFAYYDDAIRQKLLKEQRINDSMEMALKNKEFVVYFQPKYNLRSENLAGAEALVRWLHPVNGIIYPNDFIPLFEKNGFITKLDSYVWEETCKIMRKWLDAGLPPISVSVNVSRIDVYNKELPKLLLDLTKKYGIATKYLHLEITETAYTENPNQIIDAVRHLSDAGFMIEMDDFGTGYSSLNMLSDLPIDILKLDMKFIKNEMQKNGSKNILSFIISLAKWLGLLVIAEGVETREQIERLHSMDCNYVQGYYYARPMPEKEFVALIEKSVVEKEMRRPACIIPTEQVKVRKNVRHEDVMLLVDDVELNRAILAEVFKNDYTIVEADNGITALKYLRENLSKVKIVLLDLIMPIMDGFEVLSKMKASQKLKLVPVIVTSQTGAEMEIKALCMGADDFIGKPYVEQLCRKRVENVMAAVSKNK